jgi:hypothetical protein
MNEEQFSGVVEYLPTVTMPPTAESLKLPEPSKNPDPRSALFEDYANGRTGQK